MVRLALLAVLAFGFVQQAEAADAGERNLNQLILAELQPVVLQNCDLKRFGGANDGGYLLCDNLSEGIESVYSYEVVPIDDFACDVSRRYQVPVHYYNCYEAPGSSCDGGSLVFHEECVGAPSELGAWPVLDTLQNQIELNRDGDRRLIVEMDIEGAEWDALRAAPDALFEQIDQLAMELHLADDPRNLDVIRRLKQHFHLVNLHFNNHTCSTTTSPLPASVFQVLWVNKRLGVVDPSAPVPAPYSALNAPDRPDAPDCQLAPAAE